MEAIEVSDDNNSGNTESFEVNDDIDNNPANAESSEVSYNNNPGNMEFAKVNYGNNLGNLEMESFEVNDDTNPENTESTEVNDDNNPGDTESTTENIDENEGNVECIKVKLNIEKKKGKIKKKGKKKSIKVDLDKKQLRTILLYEYKVGHNAKEASLSINRAFGKETVSLRVTQLWFARFRDGDVRLGAEHPPVVNDDKLKAIIEANPHVTTREIAIELNVAQATVVRRLQQLKKSKIFGKWMTDSEKPTVSPYDHRRADRPPIIELDQLRAIVEADPRISTRQIADKLNVSQGAVCRHLKELGLTKKYGKSKTYGTWVTLTDTTNTEIPTDLDLTQGWTYH